MKKIAFLVILFCTCYNAMASHISGGQLYYEYLGSGAAPNTDRYRITMRLFRECNSTGAELNTEVVTIGIYTNPTLNLYTTLDLAKQWVTANPPSITNTPGVIPCLINEPILCYQIGDFSNIIDLPRTSNGFTLSWIRYSRQYIINILDNPYPNNAFGATFITEIPGTNQLPVGHNNSPKFLVKDTTIVCAGKNFKLDYGAVDAVDHDSLSFSFCPAYQGGTLADADPIPPPVLSLVPLPYAFPYTGSSPLGSGVTINPTTGLISGTAPPVPGKYEVNVCVSEWRNGKLLSICRKDFILAVGDCDFAAAQLDPVYLTCDGFGLQFMNQSTSAGINSYFWDFGVPTLSSDTSTQATPFYNYPDSGTFTMKLVINKGQQCTDSTTAIVEIYPGFIPAFNIQGSCYLSPFNFIDSTFTRYGVVDSWHWDFGDLASAGDTSTLRNPSYQYPSSGARTVLLTVTNSKGCLDTITKQINVFDNPLINIPFHDTLICKGDSVQLHSLVSGLAPVYTWTPLTNISNYNIPDPIVSPTDTTTYVLLVTDRGCTNTDSIKVNVIPFIFISVGNDTSICRGDSIQLNPASNALNYTWTPSTYLSDPNIKNPFAFPINTTTYSLFSSVGKCNATGSLTVKVAPYPIADAGLDTGICFGKTVQLNASITGSTFTWSPSNSLLKPNSLTPIAGPQTTTTYILSAYDDLGCPKPGLDSVTVKVIPPIKAFAGNDTIIVANQPLQLNATGGTIYNWSPFTGMNNPYINNPIVIIPNAPDTIVYRVKVSVPEGCFGYDDIKVTIFKTLPEVFIPTAFTPNGDGLNDVLKPVLAGIKSFKFFRIFNRWGNMLFSTSEIGKGWDGTFGGIKQASGTYVFEAQVEDYLGNTIIKKGTVVLIR